jgi:RNA polymerase sigma-70 factor (ECF subfamily)
MSDGGTASVGRLTEDARFSELYERFSGPVRDFCRRRLASDLVDDAVAETFLTAWRRLDDVPAGDAALVWLYRVAYRVVGHQWRSTARRRRLEEKLRSIMRVSSSGADESVMQRAERALVLVAAERLRPSDAEVLRLAAWEQLSIVDIAVVLGIAPNAVKQRLHRARQNLGREYRRLESRVTPGPETRPGGAA